MPWRRTDERSMSIDELTNEREESGACSSYPERGGRRRSQFAQSMPCEEEEGEVKTKDEKQHLRHVTLG